MRRVLVSIPLLAPALLAQQVGLLSDLRISQDGRSPSRGGQRGPIPMSMDQVLHLRWDRQALMGRFPGLQGAVDPAQEKRQQILTEALPLGIALQERLLEAKQASQRLGVLRRQPSADLSLARKQAAEAQDAYGKAGHRLFSLIAPLVPVGSPLRDRINEALLEGTTDDAPLLEVLRKELALSRQSLAALQDPEGSGYRILLQADLVDAGAASHPLHLTGYDDISTGSPRTFGRFQVLPDERAEREGKAAEAWAPLMNDAFRGTLRPKLEAQLQQAQAALAEARASMETKLGEALARLGAAGGQEVQSLRTELEGLRHSIEGLKFELGAPPATVAGLVTWIAQLKGRLEVLRAQVEGLPARLRQTAQRAATLLTGEGAQAGSDIKASLEALAAAWEAQKDWWNDRVGGPLGTLAAVAGPLGPVGAEAEAASRQARDLAGATLDTSLDLTLSKAPAYPGDEVQVQATVFRKSPTEEKWEEVSKDRQALLVEKYGWYAETRGGLLFVQSRTAGTRDTSFSAVPALAYQVKYGMEGAPWWNHGLSPSLGLSFCLLDLVDQKDFELGIALNLSLFKDVLWVGYGRDLQAKANFAYVGINPLVLYRLSKGR